MDGLPYSSSQRPLKLSIGSFNINEQPLPTNLDDWLHTVPNDDASTGVTDDVPDLLVFGFQELYPLPWAYVRSLFSSIVRWDPAAECRRQVEAAIHRRWPSNSVNLPRSNRCAHSSVAFESSVAQSLTLVNEHRRVGMSILVYARDSTVTPFVQSVQVADIGTGFLGIMGNKGAAGIRLELGTKTDEGKTECRTTLCFVNAHFAAHEFNLKCRNKDFWEVLRRMTFRGAQGRDEISAKCNETREHTDETEPLLNKRGRSNAANQCCAQRAGGTECSRSDIESSLFDNDHLFLFGDLNYRVICSHPKSGPKTDPWKASSNITFPQILSLLSNNEFHVLARYDQFKLARAAASTPDKSTPKPQFAVAQTVIPTGFQEGDVSTFRPSYKFKVGTDKYEITSPSRLPSWCDRILWYMDEEEAPPQPNAGIYKASSSCDDLNVLPNAESVPSNSIHGRAKVVDGDEFHTECPKTCLLGYASHPSIRTSDHIPVSAIFSLPIFVPSSPTPRPAYPKIHKRQRPLRPPRNWSLDPYRVVKLSGVLIADALAGVLFAFPFLLISGKQRKGKSDNDRSRTRGITQRIAAFFAIAVGTWFIWNLYKRG